MICSEKNFICRLAKGVLFIKTFRFVTKSCHVDITDVNKCVTPTAVVTVQEQATENVPVDKPVS